MSKELKQGESFEYWIPFDKKYNKKERKPTVIFRVYDNENSIVTDETLPFVPDKHSYTPGGIYKIKVIRKPGDGISAYFGTMTFQEMYHDKEFVQKCALNVQIFRESEEQRKLETKYNYGFELPDDWNEIVKLYKNLNDYDKEQVFQRMLLTKLRNYR